MRGYDPPRQATVLQDADVDKHSPLLKMPRVFELVWCDEAAGRDKGLAIWRPVPQSGCLRTLPCLPWAPPLRGPAI